MNTEDFGFENYINGKQKAAEKPISLPEPKIAKMSLIRPELGEYQAPEQIQMTNPVLEPIVANIEKAIVPLATPTLPSMPTPSMQVPKMSLGPTLPQNYVSPTPEVSKVPEAAPVVPQVETQSPTATDKVFNKPVEQQAEIKGKILTLPSTWKEEHLEKASEIAKKNGITVPELFGIFAVETGPTYGTKSVNPSSGAVGLIQFSPDTAARLLALKKQNEAVQKAKEEALAVGANVNIAIEKAKESNKLFGQFSTNDKILAKDLAKKAFLSMSLGQQLEMADFYLDNSTKGAKGIDNIYSAIFTGDPHRTRPMVKGTKEYDDNRGYDWNKDGIMTREEWTRKAKGISNTISTVKTAQAAMKVNQAKENPPVGLATTTQQRLVGEGFAPTEQNRQEVIADAANMLALSRPDVPRSTIRAAAEMVPITLVSPGTPEQAYLDKENALGAYWNNKGQEQIEVTAGVPRGAAVGLVAHELGHAINKNGEHSSMPGELMSEDATHIQQGGRPGTLQAAWNQGARALDEEHEKTKTKLRDSAPWLPDWLADKLIPDVVPSGSSNLDKMKEASGENPRDRFQWDSEKNSYPSKKKKK